MSAYIDYKLTCQNTNNSNGPYLDLKNPESIKILMEAISLGSYFGSRVQMFYRIAIEGTKTDLIRLLEETELPFNPNNIVTLDGTKKL